MEVTVVVLLLCQVEYQVLRRVILVQIAAHLFYYVFLWEWCHYYTICHEKETLNVLKPLLALLLLHLFLFVLLILRIELWINLFRNLWS